MAARPVCCGIVGIAHAICCIHISNHALLAEVIEIAVVFLLRKFSIFMKISHAMKGYILLTLSVIISLCSCDPMTEKPQYLPQQEAFHSFLKQQNSKYNKQGSEIKKSEFLDEHDKVLSQYLDSIKTFKDWRGQVTSMRVFDWETDSLKDINFYIEIKPEEYFEITLCCKYRVSLSDLATDSLYNQLKQIPDNSIIYFDGHIKRDEQNRVTYDDIGDRHKESCLSYLRYRFVVSRIDFGPSNTR